MSVTVTPYNPSWSRQFQQIASELETYLKDVPVLSIEHVGSTSVPSLLAKPIIDIDIIVTRENVRRTIDVLVAKGGFADLGERGITDRHALHSANQSPPRNVYVCVDGAFSVRNHIGVRDTLRKNAALREEYNAVKAELTSREGGISIDEYVEGKGAILQKILRASGLLSETEMEEVARANGLGNGRFRPIRTERLLLREMTLGDVDAYWKLEAKEEVVRYQNYGPMDWERARSAVVGVVKASFDKPRALFELAAVYEGSLIGRVGAKVKNGEEGASPAEDQAGGPSHASVWFSFEPAFWGQGFATEAMRAFIPLLGSPLRLEIECDPRNTGSVNMAKRLDFELVKSLDDAWESKGERVGSMVFQKYV